MRKLIYREETLDEYTQNAKAKIANAEGIIAYVYVDIGGVPTTGNGKALVVYGMGGKWVIDPAAEELLREATGRGYTEKQRNILQQSADNLNQSRPKFENSPEAMDKARKANVPIFYTSDVSSAASTEAYRQRTFHPEKSTFGIHMSDQEVQRYADIVFSNTEKNFDKAMKDRGIIIPPSKEKEGLVSIYHQSPSLLTKKDVVNALKAKDRTALIQALESSENRPSSKSLQQRRSEDIRAVGRPGDPEVLRNDQDSQRGLEAVFKGRGGMGARPKTGFYIWRTRHDDVVRLEHALREGQVFSWENPPPGGHPGEAYGCRCRAEPLKGPGY